jgi:hypothetical protein
MVISLRGVGLRVFGDLTRSWPGEIREDLEERCPQMAHLAWRPHRATLSVLAVTLPEPDDKPPSYEEVLEEQAGVISRRQALAGGLSTAAWDWRVERNTWQAVLPGVVVVHSGTVTFEEKVQAAVLYGGDDAAVSGEALIHQATPPRRRREPPAFVDISVSAGCQVAARGFFRPHRVSALAELTHPVRSPRQLRVPPAVLHAAAWAKSDRDAEWRVAAAVQQRLVNVPQLRAALQELPRLPRRGLLRLLLDDVELGAHARTELDFLAFLRRHGLPLPDRLQFEVRADGLRFLDAWWERQRVAAEVDGTHHAEVGTWDDDTLRANEILVAQQHDRLILLRVTMGNLRHQETQLAAQFAAVLR